MNFPSRRLTLATTTLLVTWGVALVLTAKHPLAQGTGKEQSVTANELSENVFKNIQVLKGIPVDEFMGTMGVFTNSLSLCCGNCHTGAGTSNPDWAADPPEKRRARQMVTMVQAINKQNFQGRQVVTCWTCHRGQLSPSTTAPFDFAYGDPVVYPPDVLPADKNGGIATVDQVFDQYFKALGTPAATNALNSYLAKGKSILYEEVGDGDPAEIYAKAPDNEAFFVHQREGDVARTYNGMTAWFQLPLTVTPQYEMEKTFAEGAKFDAAMAFPWKIRSFFTNWVVATPETIDGVQVNVLQGRTPAGMIGTLYIDKKTGLLKRMIRMSTTMVGRVPIEYDYNDYKPVAGVMMPFKFDYIWTGQREVWTLDSYQPNVTIDAAKFGKPANPDRAVIPVNTK